MSLPNLNRPLILETPVQSSDGAGGYAETWSALGTLWAKVTARTGRDNAIGEVATSQVAYKIVVRAFPVGQLQRPRPNQRFREGLRTFKIEAVTELDPRGRFLVCFANEEIAV